MNRLFNIMMQRKRWTIISMVISWCRLDSLGLWNRSSSSKEYSCRWCKIRVWFMMLVWGWRLVSLLKVIRELLMIWKMLLNSLMFLWKSRIWIVSNQLSIRILIILVTILVLIIIVIILVLIVVNNWNKRLIVIRLFRIRQVVWLVIRILMINNNSNSFSRKWKPNLAKK